MHFTKEDVLSCGIVRGFEPSRTRTCDPLVKSQLLYRLSYRPIYTHRARSRRALFHCEKTAVRILPNGCSNVQTSTIRSFVLGALYFVLLFEQEP